MIKVIKNRYLFFTKSSKDVLIFKNKNGETTYNSLESLVNEYRIDQVQIFFKNICEYRENQNLNVDSYKRGSLSLWWLYNRLIYENICLYSFKYEKLLSLLSDNDNSEFEIITSDEKLKFLIKHYCSFHGIKVTIFHSFINKVNLFFSTITKLFLTFLSLPFILFTKRKTLIFTSNNFSKFGNFDYRFFSLFSKLKSEKIKYFMGIRTTNYPGTILYRFIKRFKPVIFFDSINEISTLIYPSFSSNFKSSSYLGYLSNINNFVNLKSIDLSLSIHRLILKLANPLSALIADNCERSNILLVSCNQLLIPTIGIMNGVETIYYNVQKFNHFAINSNHLLRQKHYGVWSDGIKQYYLKKSKLYSLENLEISGKLRVSSNKATKSFFEDRKVFNICWLIEIHVNIYELIPFIKVILDNPQYSLTFKLDPTKPNNSIDYFNKLCNILKGYKLISTGITIEEASLKFDLFIGAFSTALIDVISFYTPILIIKTNQWGNYFDISGVDSLIVSFEDQVLSRIENLNYSDQLIFKNTFAPENTYSGPDWIIEKFKLYKNGIN